MKNKKLTYRVVSFLKRDELDFLDDLIKDLYFSYGLKIPRAKLIEEIIEAFKERGEQDLKGLEQALAQKLKGK